MFNIKTRWTRFWALKSDLSLFGRIAAWLATWFVPGYKSRTKLARIAPQGFISPNTVINHSDLRLGKHIFLGDRVTIYDNNDGSYVELGDHVELYSDITIETCHGGTVSIGESTHIQSRCNIIGCKGSVVIGKRVEIAPNCAFYPYNHAIDLGRRIREQPLTSNGDIIVEDDVWLGFGTIVLDGVHIGEGAVIGAGSVVTKNIPPNAIAIGSPARIVSTRTTQ